MNRSKATETEPVAPRRLWLVPTDMKTEIVTPEEWVNPLETYAGWLRASNRPMTTIKLRCYHLRRFAVQSGRTPYAPSLDDLIQHLSKDNWGAHTRRSVRSSLRSFYNWAHATGRTDGNVAALLPSVPIPPGKPRPATSQAVMTGMAQADQRVQMMIELGVKAGLRCCEIAAVHADDVIDDLVGKSLRVRGKGGRVRMIPITNETARMIRDNADGYLFPGKIDGHLSSGYVSKLVSRALPDGTTAHPLRHRFASRAYVGSGYNIRAVQELLGHSSVSTTQVYTAVDDDDLRRAALSAA